MNIVVLHNQRARDMRTAALEDVPDYHVEPNTLSVLKYQGDPYTPRRRVFDMAIEKGVEKLVIVCSPMALAHRAHWNGKGPQTLIRGMDAAQHHGLWLYMNRLLDRYGHVYVPPSTFALPWRVNPKPSHHRTSINQPTLPMVAGYRVKALTELTDEDRRTVGVGEALTRKGYDSFTMQDYFFYNRGAEQLDETGSAATWSKNYERAIARLA